MGSYVTGGGGSSSPTNPNYTFEYAGFDSAAAGSTVGDGQGRSTTAGSANVKGTAVQLLASTASAWTGLIVIATAPSTTGRYLIDVSYNGGGAWQVQNLFLQSQSEGLSQQWRLPIIVPQGSDIRVRQQSSLGSATLRIVVVGLVGASNAPGFTNCTNLLADEANTRSSTVGVTENDANWTTLIASTAQTYGAFLSSVTANSISGAHQQTVSLATGADPAEVEFARYLSSVATGTPGAPRDNSYLIERSVASGQRISVKLASASGSDTSYVGLIGFY